MEDCKHFHSGLNMRIWWRKHAFGAISGISLKGKSAILEDFGGLKY